MIALKRKSATPADPATVDLGAARERWAAVDAKYREMIERGEAMRLALSLTAAGHAAGHESRAPKALREKAPAG